MKILYYIDKFTEWLDFSWLISTRRPPPPPPPSPPSPPPYEDIYTISENKLQKMPLILNCNKSEKTIIKG